MTNMNLKLNKLSLTSAVNKLDSCREIVITPTTRSKLAWLVTGLVQSDGCFGMRVFKYKKSIGISFKLTIEMTMTSLPLLKQVQAYFGCGSIYFNKKRNTCIYSISAKSELWHIVVPHFLNYPLFGSKYESFVKFLKAFTLFYPIQGKNQDKLTLAKVLFLGWNINEYSSVREEEDIFIHLNKLLPSLQLNFESSISFENKMLIVGEKLGIESSNNILMNSLKYLDQYRLVTINPYFIVGVIEGDGSFYVGLRGNGKIRFGFNITTSIDDLMLLFNIKLALCCGVVKAKAKSWCRYESEGNKDLRNTLMLVVKLSPFGDKLIGSKSTNYEIFREVMGIFAKKGHMEKEGLRRIAQLVYSGATLKNRKLTLEEYLKKHNLLI